MLLRFDTALQIVPKKKSIIKLSIVCTTARMCLNSYRRNKSVYNPSSKFVKSLVPYQRLNERRKAIRYRNKSCIPYNYRY